MNTKICPNCNAEVPGVAHLCKHCFHDFHVVMPKRKSPLFTLLFLAVTVGVGAWQFPQVRTGFQLWWQDLVARL